MDMKKLKVEQTILKCGKLHQANTSASTTLYSLHSPNFEFLV